MRKISFLLKIYSIVTTTKDTIIFQVFVYQIIKNWSLKLKHNSFDDK